MKRFLISFFVGLIIASIVLGLSVKAHAADLPPVLSSCGYTVEELEERLKYDLKPYARAFLNAEEDYGINACFLASIAALESGWGRYPFQDCNIFGFFSKRTFGSVEENIDFVAWWLFKHYIREDGRYYRGGTIEAIGSIYCPDGGEWVQLVSGIYYKLIYN